MIKEPLHRDLAPSAAFAKVTAFARRGVPFEEFRRIVANQPRLVEAAWALGYDKLLNLYDEEKKRKYKKQFLAIYEHTEGAWQ